MPAQQHPHPIPLPQRERARLVTLAAVISAVLAACGGGDAPRQTSDGTERKLALATTSEELSVVLPNLPDPLFDGLAIPADAPLRGMWSATRPWPMNGLHAVLLPEGKVLTYGTPQNTPATQDGRTYDVWDPSLGFGSASHVTTVDATRVNSFCSTAAWRADGSLMLSGGNTPLGSSLMTPSTGAALTDTATLADQRWYATMLTLPDGRNLILGGMDPYQEGMRDNPDAAIAAGTVSMTPEIYTAGTGWRSLIGARSRDAFGPDYLRASYPRAWVAPSGRVVGISAETLWSLDVAANDGAGSVTVHGRFKRPASATDPVNVGATSTAVMFAPGRVLQVGGNGYFNGDGLPASNLATMVDFNGSEPVVTEAAPMTYARRLANSVVLPDGKVVVTGGTRVGNNGGSDAVYAAEIWDPATGTWTLGASAAQVRVYHSATLLLANGTVLSTGGGAPGPVNNLNAEVYYPPYLFKSVDGGAQFAPRPVLTSVNALSFNHGDALRLRVGGAARIAKLVLIAGGAVTHSFNSGQRFQELAFTQDGALLSATLPTSASLAPPGRYQIVALDADGVPSRAVVVALGLSGALPAVQSNITRQQAVTLESANAAGQSVQATGDGGAALAATPNTARAPAAAQFWVRHGLADAGCLSLESVAAPGQWLRRREQAATVETSDASAAFAADATFCPQAGRSGTGVSLRSFSAPDSFLRHHGAQLGCEPAGSDTDFDADASFVPRSTLPVNATIELGTVAVDGSVVAVDAGNLGVLAALGATPTDATLAPARYAVRAGLGDASCVSLESVANPGRWLRHAAYRVQSAAFADTALFRADATFCPEPGLAGAGLTLRSKNFPARVVHHRDGQVWIDTQLADAAFGAGASFTVRPLAPATPLPTLTAFTAEPVGVDSPASWSPGLDAAGLQFGWDFGDGTSSAFAASSAASHRYAAPGLYLVTLTVRNASSQTSSRTFMQAVTAPRTAGTPQASSQLLVEPRSDGTARLWVVNPDNDSVSVFDPAGTRLAEIATGAAPRSLARAPDGRVWVVNRDDATVSVIDADALATQRMIVLPRASQPYGIVVAASGRAYVSLSAAGAVAVLGSADLGMLGAVAVGPDPRQLSLSADGTRLFVSRFITPALPGEGTAMVATAVDGVARGGEVVVVDTTTSSVRQTIVLRHSERSDTEISGSGVPNYLGAAAISPDGTTAWVPSKQDNVKRGALRNGASLDFQNTVRAVSSRIDLATLAEDAAARIDHDNASVASAAVYDASGAYLFVALETARQVAVLDARSGAQLLRIEAGLAPQALAVAPDNGRLYVHNFMGRSVQVVDITPLTRRGELRASTLATLATVAGDKLTATVLLGKQLFYDARDSRLARDAYLSCASCHHDGGHDGRTWDLSAQGEGLRNTIALRGRSGMAHGRLHWSGNFDEVQDFEGQIRALAGGTGLMSDDTFNAGTRSQPLGASKAGLSSDLDALAAYVASLSRFAPSPQRSATGELTTAASAGRAAYTAQQCASCHGGTSFATSGVLLADVGTIKASSGKRLGALLPGIDVPTLRDVASTAPYLHDGSAATLADAVRAHRGITLAATDIDNLVAYLGQIGQEEVAAPAALPAGAVRCASERGTCTLTSGTPATVYYGANGQWFSRGAVSGSIACSNSVFGDPLYGTAKACYYIAATKCGNERGNCSIPAGSAATVLYGANGRYHARSALTGTIACNNATFGDPIVGTAKGCWRQ